MTPTRPYLIRAFFDWIVDNELTPYILVDATVAGVKVPSVHVRDGRIVLNVSPSAVAGLDFGLDQISFSARFGGVAQTILLPVSSVMAVYARENGQGMFFSDEELVDENGRDSVPTAGPAGTDSGVVAVTAPAKPFLRLVK